jgi:hypothetical protein
LNTFAASKLSIGISVNLEKEFIEASQLFKKRLNEFSKQELIEKNTNFASNFKLFFFNCISEKKTKRWVDRESFSKDVSG